MTDRHTIVRFDAHLVVHLATQPLGCGGAVVVGEPLGWYGDPRHGTRRTVRRCGRQSGHVGPHALGEGATPVMTDCGLQLAEGAWIDWAPSFDDPRCATCHGVEAAPTDDLLTLDGVAS